MISLRVVDIKKVVCGKQL